MSKEYIIHCDESTAKGEFCSNFYGGALVRGEHLEIVRDKLSKKKAELNFHGEIKWDKVTANYLDKYKSLMDHFFDFVEEDVVKIRIMFTQNSNRPKNLTAVHVEETYFILYYEFVKHAFGLAHCNDGNEPIRLRLLLDQLPENNEKADRFRAYICSLEKNRQFREANLILTRNDISDVCSHDHDILQCLDVVMGSMQFRLNLLHKVVPKGSRRRGKRTRAKEALYKHINARIRAIYPGFNVGMSTGTPNGVEDRWRHSYRHWCFVPNDREFDASKTKKR